LPNRRSHVVIEFGHAGFIYTAGIGFFDDVCRQPAEIFLTTNKQGSLVDINARDGAIAASLLLQHGCPVETLRRALTRNGDGSASGPLAHVLDLLQQQTEKADAVCASMVVCGSGKRLAATWGRTRSMLCCVSFGDGQTSMHV
jgi:ribonucleoside-diphosphate reductase alpha chain